MYMNEFPVKPPVILYVGLCHEGQLYYEKFLHYDLVVLDSYLFVNGSTNDTNGECPHASSLNLLSQSGKIKFF